MPAVAKKFLLSSALSAEGALGLADGESLGDEVTGTFSAGASLGATGGRRGERARLVSGGNTEKSTAGRSLVVTFALDSGDPAFQSRLEPSGDGSLDKVEVLLEMVLRTRSRFDDEKEDVLASEDGDEALSRVAGLREMCEKWRALVLELRAAYTREGIGTAHWAVSAGPDEPRTEYEPDVEELIRLHQAAVASGHRWGGAAYANHGVLYRNWRGTFGHY